MEASALTHASRRGLLARKSPLLKLQGDEKLIAMARAGNAGAFETIVDRYQGRLLGFCRQMLGSTEDAEDVLQEVFVNAYRAMLADEREINLRPWLYRIARNRCLNHLRKPSADAQESMDMVPEVEAASTAEKVHNREEFRQIIADVNKLPETQRSALLLREMDALSYEEIADAMETTVPSVKSLLVRARISLGEASQARLLTCGEVRVELSEAAEGLRKVSAPVRRHVRECEECADFRSQVRSNEKLLAAIFPVPAAVRLQGLHRLQARPRRRFRRGQRGGRRCRGRWRRGCRGRRGERHRRRARRSGAASGLGGLGGAIGGAIGTKAVAGVVTAAVLTAGAAVELPEGTPLPRPGARADPRPRRSARRRAPPRRRATGGVEAAISHAVDRSVRSRRSPATPSRSRRPKPKKPKKPRPPLAPTEEVPAAPVRRSRAARGSRSRRRTRSRRLRGRTFRPASPAGSKSTGGTGTTVAGAHGGKGTVTVTVTPETPAGDDHPAPGHDAPPATPPPAEAAPSRPKKPARRRKSGRTRRSKRPPASEVTP